MVLSNAIIVVSVFVCRQKCGCCFLHNLRLSCLVLVDVRGKKKKSVFVHRKLFFLSRSIDLV